MANRRAALYCRISSDPTGREAGVQRQERDCRRLADARGWRVVEVYTDDDVSAWSGKPRPAYARMLADIREGKISAIVAWHPDRLYRRLRDLLDLIPVVEEHHVLLATVTASDIDLSTATGRATAKTSAVWQEHESDHKAERIRSASEERAERGAPHGRSVYGWTRHREFDDHGRKVASRDELDPDAAKLIKDAAARVLAGDSVRAIVRDLNDRGIPTSGGGQWQPASLRRLLLRPANAGLRVHRGHIVGPSVAPEILERDTWEAVVAVLKDPRRRSITTNARRHLLTGLASCAVCGSPIRSHRVRGLPMYTCQERHCVARKQEWVDTLVERVVIERLSRRDAAELLRSDRGDEIREARDEADVLRRRMADAADQFADGVITAQQLAQINERVRPRLADAEVRSRPSPALAALEGVVGVKDVAGMWSTLPLERKRAVIDALMTVQIAPTNRGNARALDLNSVRITWK